MVRPLGARAVSTPARQTSLDLWCANFGPYGTCCRVPVAAKTFATVLVVGHYVLRIRFDELPGVCAGGTGKPS
jgi:hypothetical protein